MAGRDTQAPQTPAEVQAEIEREQQLLAQTLDELTEQARPANIARRGLNRARSTGAHLAEEARALVLGGAVRMESHPVEPPEGSIRLKGDEDMVTTYQARGRLPAEALILGAGVGLAVAVGVVAWAVRRRRR